MPIKSQQTMMREYLKRLKQQGKNLNSRGEIINPTRRDVRQFNQAFTTTKATDTANKMKGVVRGVAGNKLGRAVNKRINLDKYLTGLTESQKKKMKTYLGRIVK